MPSLKSLLRSFWKRLLLLAGLFFVPMAGRLVVFPIEGTVVTPQGVGALALGSLLFGGVMSMVLGYPIEQRRRLQLEHELEQLKLQRHSRF